MKSAVIFVVGLAIGASGFFAWAYFQLRKEAAKLPTVFDEALLERLPFDREWFVYWGGSGASQNAHHGFAAQHLAVDLVLLDATTEKTHKENGKSNDDYLCFGQPIFAAHDGTVVISVDGIPDNQPGTMNQQMVYGNTLMIQHALGFVSVYAHLKSGSVVKKVGEPIKSGDRIGLCGNSGNSSGPHLHFHVQDKVGFEQGFAMRPVFKQALVNGASKTNHSPTKSERVSN